MREDLMLLRAAVVREALATRQDMLDTRRRSQQEEREEYFTGQMVHSLVRRGRGRVAAQRVPGRESVHGADLEVWFRLPGLFVGLRLQAKKLSAPKKHAPTGRYDELHHKIGRDKPRRSQVDALIAHTPPGLNAGYLLYNGIESKPLFDDGCCTYDGFQKQHGYLGLTVTSAELVRRLRDDGKRRCAEDVIPRAVPLQCLVLCHGRWPFWGDVDAGPVAAMVDGLSEFDTVVALRDVESAEGSDILPGRVSVVDLPVPSYVRQVIAEEELSADAAPDATFVMVLDLRRGDI